MPNEDTTPHGGLATILDVRGAHEEGDHEAEIRLEHREALIYTLGKAAELEHLVMCQYLYAAFSLKESEAEGVPGELLPTVKRWKRELLAIGGQEMLHLALVQNLLAAVGAAPRLARPNLPLPPRAYPAGVQIALLPFGEAALRHFAFLERPEGMAMEDTEEFAALQKAVELPRPEEDEIGPRLQEFDTIGHLYRSIQHGIASLAESLGEERLFIGPLKAQATEKHFRWEELVAVHDVASAHAAIETIVEQGEGARGDWKDAHFGRLIRMLDEYVELRAANPDFEPARPVLLAHVREPSSGAEVTLIEDPFTARLADLLNATYEVLLQLLSRYFANSGETPEQLATLADVAVTLMFATIKPLGSVVARLQVGPSHPGRHRGAGAGALLRRRLPAPAPRGGVDDHGRAAARDRRAGHRCRDACIPAFMPHVSRVTDAMRAQADRLAAAAG